MFGDTTKAGAVDLLAALAINGFGSHKAAQSPTLRWEWGQGAQTGQSSILKDYRFGGLVLGALGFAFGDGGLQRASYDLASGAGHSLMATEMVRRQAIARLQAPGVAQVPGAPAMAPQLAPPVQQPEVQQGMYGYAYAMPGTFR